MLYSMCEEKINFFTMHLSRRNDAEVLELKTSGCEGCPQFLLVKPSLMGDDVAMTTDALIREYIRLDGVSEYVCYEERTFGLQKGSKKTGDVLDRGEVVIR